MLVRYIDTGINNCFWNMAVDEAILKLHVRDRVPPTLRVYRWFPPALSIGHFQSMQDDIREEKCRQIGIDVVRRVTGGSAVLHSDELTYSVVTSERYGIPKSIVKSFRLLNEGLIAAYRILGLDVCLVSSKKETSSAACFTNAGLADLTYKGRKIAGSAQCRRGDALLQHGSLPLTIDDTLYLSLLKFKSDSAAARISKTFGKKVLGMRDILGSDIGLQEIKRAIIKGFQDGLGITLYKGSLTPEEMAVSQQLADEKYNTFSWNFYGKETVKPDNVSAL